jgi:hypothetical protein
VEHSVPGYFNITSEQEAQCPQHKEVTEASGAQDPGPREAEMGRTVVQSQAGAMVFQDAISKTLHKRRAGGVARGGGPEFKSYCCKYRTIK